METYGNYTENVSIAITLSRTVSSLSSSTAVVVSKFPSVVAIRVPCEQGFI